MNLIQNQTMLSTDLLKIINAERKSNNEPIVRLNKFNEKIEDELEGENYTKSVVQNFNNTESIVYQLTRDQVILLSMRESKAVRRSVLNKLKAIDNKALDKHNYNISRQESKLEYRPMTDAIALAHEEIKPYHFSNEADLINRIVLGCTSSKFRKENDILDGDAIRDYLTKTQLDCIISLQRANTVYIEDGINFQDRKIKLQSLFDRKFKERLIQEIHLINA
ncbi:MAG: hypothetical protein J5965_20665 [Aeriscardovia sp.]|nr:hypothetical protein [Aeriscardovia sp.]